MPDTLLIIAVILLVIGIPVLIAMTAETDRKEWGRFARRRGWQYSPVDRELVADLNLEPFGRGTARTARHVVRGTHRGLPMRLFRYEHTTGSADDPTTHQHSVAQYVSGAEWPDLEVYRGWRLRLSRHIDFDDDRFDQLYDVRSPDRDFAHRFVHPQFMTALLDGALGEYHLALENGVFTLWRARAMRVDHVDEMLAKLITVLELVPAQLWTDGEVFPPLIGPPDDDPGLTNPEEH